MTLQEQKPKKYKKLKTTCKIIGFFIILYITFVLGFNYENESKTPVLTDNPTTVVENTEEVVHVSYDELLRNNELYVGKSVIKTGVIMSSNYDDNSYIIGTKYDGFTWWNNDFYSSYSGSRFLDNDKVQFQGTILGIKEFYDIPEIEIYNIELIR